MSQLVSAPQDLEQLKKQAKTLLKSVQAGDLKAICRFAAHGLFKKGKREQLKLADAQLVVARDKGFPSWRKLRDYIQERVAESFFAALTDGKFRKVKLLLAEYPELAHQREEKSKLLPLQIAVQGEHHELVRLLMELEKPKSLATSSFLPFQSGSGNEIWRMINASYTGDLPTIEALVERSPELVNCHYDYQHPLHLAVINGHVEVAKFLIEHGADVTKVNYLYQDSLVTVVADRQVLGLQEVIRKSLEKRFPYYAPGEHEILRAAAEGNQERIQGVLAASPGLVNVCAEDGNTPLHLAVTRNNEKLVRYLIEAGADANALNKHGFKPIHCALFANTFWSEKDRNLPLARYLRESGTDDNIHLAALFGDLKGVRDFLSQDPKLANFNDSCNKRPLSSAAAEGHTEIVQLLLDSGANPSAAEENAPRGYAIYAAAAKNHPAVVELLLQAGADPYAPVHASGNALSRGKENPKVLQAFKRFVNGEAPLSPDDDPLVAAILENHLETVRRLLNESPELAANTEAFHGEGYLAIAASRGLVEMVDLLLEHGATIPDQSNWGTGYSFKHLDLARKFLENGANPNHCNWLKRTILHEFAFRGEIDKIRLLLEFGVELDPIDLEYRSTPLGFAARGGQVEAVRVLLEAGADPDLPERPAWAKPLAWAKARNHSAIVALLERS